MAKKHLLDKRADQIIGLGEGHPDDLLDTPALARWLGVSVIWLELGRMPKNAYGPPFERIGKRMIRYQRDKVLRWLESRTVDPEAAGAK
jgi:predicted DNA-binding transcriptional regulator AlpA